MTQGSSCHVSPLLWPPVQPAKPGPGPQVRDPENWGESTAKGATSEGHHSGDSQRLYTYCNFPADGSIVSASNNHQIPIILQHMEALRKACLFKTFTKDIVCASSGPETPRVLQAMCVCVPFLCWEIQQLPRLYSSSLAKTLRLHFQNPPVPKPLSHLSNLQLPFFPGQGCQRQHRMPS